MSDLTEVFEEALLGACSEALSVAIARGDWTAVRVIQAVQKPVNRESMERLARVVIEAVNPND